MNACFARLHVRLSAAMAGLMLTIAAFGVVAASASPDVHAVPQPSSASATATVLEVNGAIGPATSRYVIKAIDTARINGAHVVILQIDTPGGLDTSMRDIIRAILASPIPVVSYVSPPGARAASAGTYILYASHIAAMAPATNLGAATPVSIGGNDPAPSPLPTSPKDQRGADQAQGGKSGADQTRGDKQERNPARHESDAGQSQPDNEDHRREADRSAQEPSSPLPSTAMERKVVNDAVAYIRGLAELRGRNGDWAEQAVRGAASLSANAALEQGVIDIVARDVPDLLAQIDGREVRIANKVVKLATRDLTVEHVKPDWRVELLSVITNPTIAYGLMLIGIYGLLFEGYNPGAVFPGVVGGISLLLALFAFQILSVNYAGLALVALGVSMIVAEFFFPTFGSLGLGGLIAFVVGSLILFDSDVPGMSIGWPVIGGVATVGGLVILGMAWLANRSLRRPVVTGVQAMIGEKAEVLEAFSDRGRIRYGGELWNVRSAAVLQTGQIVRITRVEGLTLWVEPA